MSILGIEDFKRQVILALFSDNTLLQQLVLKGGNLLDVVYGISTRPSMDIDFSICGEFEDLEGARRLIAKALERWFERLGYVVFDVQLAEKPPMVSPEFRSFWGGYKVDFKTVDRATYERLAGDVERLRMAALVVDDAQGKKFPIEISKYEYVAEKVPETLDDMSVYVYSPAMLVAEKLRAICQQTDEYASLLRKHRPPRGRDFLDIHTAAEHFRLDFGNRSFHDTVRKVFAAKRVELALLSRIGDEETGAFHGEDFVSVRGTVKPDVQLQPFEYYHRYVADKCRLLEPLWNV